MSQTSRTSFFSFWLPPRTAAGPHQAADTKSRRRGPAAQNKCVAALLAAAQQSAAVNFASLFIFCVSSRNTAPATDLSFYFRMMMMPTRSLAAAACCTTETRFRPAEQQAAYCTVRRSADSNRVFSIMSILITRRYFLYCYFIYTRRYDVLMCCTRYYCTKFN